VRRLILKSSLLVMLIFTLQDVSLARGSSPSCEEAAEEASCTPPHGNVWITCDWCPAWQMEHTSGCCYDDLEGDGCCEIACEDLCVGVVISQSCGGPGYGGNCCCECFNGPNTCEVTPAVEEGDPGCPLYVFGGSCFG
jgi:hypothetical protein